ncbi:MAG: hypothetical protein CMJ81_10915 [Planctomycetaceae bacterium]|nr:hypothetical protein [Planctomycetaceae bacterium]
MAKGPLALIRKYQKVLLAVFGVMIMFAFMLPNVPLRRFDSDEAPPDDTVVEWNDGRQSLDENQMYRKVARHRQTARFLAFLATNAIKKGGKPQGIQVDREGNVRYPGIAVNDSELARLHTILLAEQATQMGLVVDEHAIDRFINQITGGVLTSQEIQEIQQQALHNRMDNYVLRLVLREELLSQKIGRLAFQNPGILTPGDSWDFYNRIFRQVTAETVVFNTTDFVSDVLGPTDAQTEEFYEKYKDQTPNPNSPEPGFSIPRQVAVEFLAADMSVFLDQVKSEITDQEVAEYYQKNKEDFKRPEPFSPESTPSDDPDDSPPAEPEPPSEPEPDVPNNASSLEDDPRQAVPRPPGPGQPTGPFEDESRSDSASESEPVTPDDESADANEDESTEPVDSKGTTETAKDETIAADPGSDLDLDFSNTPTVSEASDQPDHGYQTLEEVADRIREILAIPTASGRVTERVREARSKLLRYFEDYQERKANELAGKKETTELKRPDFNDLAEQLGLRAGIIPLTDQREMFNSHKIGRSRSTEGLGGTPFLDMVFGNDTLLSFMPKQTLASSRLPGTETNFVFWKTDEQESRVPPLSEIKEQVMDAWKEREALQFTLQAAQKLAEQANNSQESLSQIENQREVRQIGPFTWMTISNFTGGSPQVHLSRVPDLPDAGPDFLRDVFSLAAGKAGTAVNHQRNKVYAVQITEEVPDLETRRREFFQLLDESDGHHPLLTQLSQYESREMMAEWLAQLVNDKKVVWKRPPRLESLR